MRINDVKSEASANHRQSGLLRRDLLIALVLGSLVIVAGLAYYAVSQRAVVSSGAAAGPTAPVKGAEDSNGAAAGPTPLFKGATVWDQLDPRDLTAALRAFDLRIADEEREATARASRTTQ